MGPSMNPKPEATLSSLALRSTSFQRAGEFASIANSRGGCWACPHAKAAATQIKAVRPTDHFVIESPRACYGMLFHIGHNGIGFGCWRRRMKELDKVVQFSRG